MLSATLQNARSQQARDDPKPRLYVVATAHLDSQWNWTVQDSIREFVPNTFFENFKRFEQYPDYTFNYEGAIHYMWFKEYHPDAWPTLQKYVAAGRWRLAGSWINAVDVNVPSPESLMRQALYGKRFLSSGVWQSQSGCLPAGLFRFWLCASVDRHAFRLVCFFHPKVNVGL